MNQSILKKYATYVCVLAMFALLYFGVTGIYSAIGYTWPTFTMNADIYTRYQKNIDFWGCTPPAAGCIRKAMDGHAPTEQEVTELRLSEISREIQKEKMSSAQSAIKSLLYFIGASIIYLGHGKLAFGNSANTDLAT